MTMKLSVLGQFLLVICCLTAVISAMPNPQAQAPSGALVATAESGHFSYDDPNKWKEHNSLCAGEHQSPINIDTRKSKTAKFPPFRFHNYAKGLPENLENNGHTVQLTIDNLIKDLPTISGGGLEGPYEFAQMHFHWGEDEFGSEHKINNKQYAGEVHIVHWNKKYGNFVNATKHNDGLAVLGILIDLQDKENIAFSHIEQFDDIRDASKKNEKLPYSVPLKDLLPSNVASFFRYEGSLTDARCNEDVIWTVFETPIHISHSQLEMFRQLNDDEGEPLSKNVRPTQHEHDRIVTYSGRAMQCGTCSTATADRSSEGRSDSSESGESKEITKSKTRHYGY
ncbi:putative carbonic anhydrase 3 [Daphnia pulex]|uniref:putative carbonic anhydrase 3 n=1 Tax=Daphnia pulex TaxID=6669 RepID=UPI001EDE53BD|nr:putative carbonic anhydrase 3 [Daphnia pulex]